EGRSARCRGGARRSGIRKDARRHTGPRRGHHGRTCQAQRQEARGHAVRLRPGALLPQGVTVRRKFNIRDPQVMALSAGAVVLLVLLYFVFRDRPATQAECKEMLEHYLDMTIELDPELAKLPPEQQAAAREMKRAIRTTDKAF